MAIHSLDVVNEVPKLFPFPNVLARTDSMDYLDWLKARKQGIGGSVMAALFGMSPWGTPASVYFELTEEMPARDESEIMEMGHIMEPVIADVFQQKTGKRVTRAPFLFQHPEEPWLIGNIDFALVDEDAGLECKNAGEYKREEFEDGEVPDYYFIQCQHYMAVTGKSKWYLAAIIGGNKFRYFEIPRDEGIIEAIRKKAREFWNDHILPRKMPALDGHTATTSAVKMLYGAENGETVDLLESIDDMFEELLRLKASAKELAGEIDRIENEIKVAIGDATLGITPAGRKIKYTTVNVGEKVVNAYSFRRLWLPKK